MSFVGPRTVKFLLRAAPKYSGKIDFNIEETASKWSPKKIVDRPECGNQGRAPSRAQRVFPKKWAATEA